MDFHAAIFCVFIVLSTYHNLCYFGFYGNTEPSHSRGCAERTVPNVETPRKVLTCYGCGASGTVRSRCPKCNPSAPSHTETAQTADFEEFNAGELLNDKIRRPLLPITILGRLISTKFIVLDTEVNNRTLLGADFLMAASIILDLDGNLWFFKDEPNNVHSFLSESYDSELCINSAELRDDEATLLNDVQREQLLELISQQTATFALGGEPTAKRTN
ncbi:hypothetical protein FQR65_LT04020 [Abscondita terminalis]|nr:hypothetical protein FQR65_LT04020 [Abscondita terminalis]